MSTTPPPLPTGEQRLHRFSWLFLCVTTSRQFLLAIVGLLFFGNRLSERWAPFEALLPVLILALVAGASVIAQLTYRYSIGLTHLSVRSGVFERQWREIPFTRIHNVSLRQSMLHRLFGVAELKLESAGSPKPEADMKVLPLDRALALEQLIRQYGHTQTGMPPLSVPEDTAPTHDDQASAPLLRLSAVDLLRMGLLSNRGMLVVLAALGAVNQIIPDDSVKRLIRSQADQWVDQTQRQTLQHLSLMEWVGVGIGLLVLAMALTRLLSVALVMVQYFGFELRRQGARLTQARGLFSRQRANVGTHRIQAWTIHQPLMHGWFGQQQIHVDIASGAATGKEQSSFRELVPLIASARCASLLQELAPGLNWPPATWQPVGRQHFWRLMLPALCVIPLACAMTQRFTGAWAWAGLTLLLPVAWGCWRKTSFTAWHLDDRTVALRSGSWAYWWRTTELRKVQSASVHRSPLDRLCGTASLRLDTAGKPMGEPGLVIPFLPVPQAQRLLESLCARLSQPRP